MYIEVINGRIVPGTQRGKPNWIDAETNEYLTDEQLIRRENLFPVIEDPPEHDEFYQKIKRNDPEEWIVYSDSVPLSSDSFELSANYVKTTYTIEDFPINKIKERVLEDLENLRFKYETDGISFTTIDSQELEIDTSRESQNKILGMHVAVSGGYKKTASKWKTKNGFVSISASDMSKMALQLLDFVQSCYDRESDIFDKISSIDLQNYSTAIESFKSIKNNEFKTDWPTIALFKGDE